MNEIKVTPQMTWREYNALRYGKIGPIAFWAVLALGAACLASSAALTWATPPSILAGVALAAFIFISLLLGLFNVGRQRQAYERFRDANISYVFTGERIQATWRYGQSSFAWAAVDRVMERRTIYLLDLGNRYIGIPKRDIQPPDVGPFIQLLRTHGLLKEQ